MKLKSALFLFLFTIVLTAINCSAQNYNVRRESKSIEDDKKFKDRLWYGGGVNLGFGGSGGYSLFSFGLSPMVGYKFTSDFSMGPRVGFTFNNYRYRLGSRIDKLVTVDLAGGIFARYKFFNVVFAHAEFDLTRYQYPIYNQVTDKLDKITVNGRDALIGVGYNSGMGEFGTELYLMYNLLADENIISQPFEFRFGVTYKF